MGWIIGAVVLLAAVAIALGLVRDASLSRRISREVRDPEDR
jgi:hypothetical protein